ncbi:sphingosine kinase 1-like [Quercus robur]|uniref:sphingosine kinase 1-like n=1 Tax=Quercus robur TaxID=38942 RepID=UPI0021627230|nr:sphingosine kinase 1-like [Quercus robur]
MEQPENPAEQPIVSDRVIINGSETPLTLTADGKLRMWERGQRCLTVKKEVLGFVTEGSKIRIRAVVKGGGAGICCVASKGALVRKDFVFQPLSNDSLNLWSQKLRQYIDSLGKYLNFLILILTINFFLVGTGNGMVKSLLDSVGYPCTAPNAVLTIIRGHKRSLDVATILQRETKFFSILMLAWGLVADIDIESEKYRWMGSARIDFYGLQRILHLRQYNGCVSFVPAPGFETYGEPTSYPNKSTGKPDSCNPSEEESIKVRHHGYQGPNIDLENLEWRTISGPFVSVWLHNVPWGSEGTLAAPDAKFSDGYLDLIIMRDCPQLALMSLMTGLNDGSHVKSPHVTYLKVKAFVLEPGPQTKEPTKEGIIDSDGEVLARGKGTYKCDQKAPMAYDKLQIAVHQGLATLFSPL